MIYTKININPVNTIVKNQENGFIDIKHNHGIFIMSKINAND